MTVTTAPTRKNNRDLGRRMAELLAAELFSGQYAPGDYLPKETELCERFGMSRASVRSGLQQLVALGIVTRISGRGTVVEEYRDWNVLDPQVTRWMTAYAEPNPGFLREIFEFRHAVEPFIAMVAAQRATARDLVAMEEAFEGMERSLESGQMSYREQSFSDYDVAFHAAIYRATHNLVWGQLAHILRPSIMLVVTKSNDTAEQLRDSLERHRQLMESIRLRRPEAAFDAAVRVMSRTAYDLGLGEARDDSAAAARWRAQWLGELSTDSPSTDD